MRKHPERVRHERKFLPDGFTPAELIARVRCHPAVFRESYPERVVNNLYFDSPDLRHYHDHVDGMANRLKFRVRWYGDFRGRIERPVLEVKSRQGLVGAKSAYALPPITLNGDWSRRWWGAAFEPAGLPDRVRLQLAAVEPKLANRYRRRYFCTADGQVRLTVDFALEFLDPRHGSLAPVRALQPPVILELKYDPANSAAAARIANAFPFRLTRCSKYILGMDDLLGL